MSYAIAAAGTGGHVYPGLAVGEALVALGVAAADILYVGGDRLEAKVYPGAGFPFLGLELSGLQRRFTVANLSLPLVVARARRRMAAEFEKRGVRVVLALGGYVTVPAALAARASGAALAVSEQNAEAGLANRLAAPFAARVFGAFPTTAGLPGAEWVGNPIRASLARFDRRSLAGPARRRWAIPEGRFTVGVLGGSLGSTILNRAVVAMLARWQGPEMAVIHVAGRGHEEVAAAAKDSPHLWRVLEFCDEMDLFYAACDLVVSRAGGAVAELTATSSPAVLVPGSFGSGRHQLANAGALAEAAAAVVVEERDLGRLGEVVGSLADDRPRRERMAAAAAALARPDAAEAIARAMVELGERR